MRTLEIDNNIIRTPLIDIVKDVKFRLTNSKLATIELKQDDIRITCPFHKQGHEHKASADIYIGEDENIPYGLFKCFTCGTKAPFYHFVAQCFEISDEKAKQWLIENYSSGKVTFEYNLEPIVLNEPKKKTEILDESILKRLQNYHPYMDQRKLDRHILEVFEVKYDPINQCLVFPVRNEKGKLTMLTRRSVNTKFFSIDKQKEKPLYLLYYMLQNNIEQFMITEGQIDALTACGFGFPCVATIGAISDHQIELLNKSNVRVLYTMFDNDDAGKRFTEKLMKNIRKDIIVINVDICVPNKKDINDLTEEEFYYCIKKSEEKF